MSLCGVATRFRSLVARGLSPGASASFSRLGRPRRVQFVGYAGSFGRADPLQDRQRLPQPVFGVGGAAGGLGAPAQPGQRVRLLQGDAELAGQVQGLLVA